MCYACPTNLLWSLVAEKLQYTTATLCYITFFDPYHTFYKIINAYIHITCLLRMYALSNIINTKTWIWQPSWHGHPPSAYMHLSVYGRVQLNWLYMSLIGAWALLHSRAEWYRYLSILAIPWYWNEMILVMTKFQWSNFIEFSIIAILTMFRNSFEARR